MKAIQLKAMQITKVTENACRKVFLNEHAKFASRSMILKEDLDRSFEFDDKTFTIVGQWINEASLDIIIKDSDSNYYRGGHKEISLMMGYKNYRNRVTGIEHNTEASVSKRFGDIMEDATEEDINFLENMR